MTLNVDPRAKATTLYHGEFRPMFIGGKWVPAQSGQEMQALNPATGEMLATVPRGGAADIGLWGLLAGTVLDMRRVVRGVAEIDGISEVRAIDD